MCVRDPTRDAAGVLDQTRECHLLGSDELMIGRRRLVGEVLGRYDMTVERFVETDSDDLRDLWLMVEGALSAGPDGSRPTIGPVPGNRPAAGAQRPGVAERPNPP